VLETENLFIGGPGTISTIERRTPYRSYHTGGHGISRRHSATAGSTIPIRRALACFTAAEGTSGTNG
jgi:hypothetical protein